MGQYRRVAAEAAHRFGRHHDLVIVGGSETPNGRAIEDHAFGAERSRGAASPTGEDKAMIDTEDLDRLEPAPGDLMISQIERSALVKVVGYKRGAIPVGESAVALDCRVKSWKKGRGQRSAMINYVGKGGESDRAD